MPILRAGLSCRAISPLPGIYLMGYGNRVQGNIGIHDDVYVTTLSLDDGQRQAAILTVDHTFIHPTVIEQVKKRLPEIASEAIFICCSHTHAGPIGYADVSSRPEDIQYIAFLVDQLVRSVREASANRQPVSLYSGQSDAYININRRERTPQGAIVIGNNRNGLVDHTVQVVQVRTEQNALLATLVNYACHPVVMGPFNRYVSADWVGAMRRAVETDSGSLCLFVQGATADVNPRQMRWTVDSWDEVDEQGSAVADAVGDAASRMQRLAIDDGIQSRQETVWLPLSQPAGPISQLQQFFKEAHSDEALQAELHKVFPWHVDLQTRDGVLHSPIQIGVLRVGEWALAAMATEPFTETGLAIKAASPAKTTFVAGYTNGCNSYLPVANAYQQGGYEVETAPLFYGLPSGFAQGGAETITSAVQSLFV